MQPVWLDGYFTRHFKNASEDITLLNADFRLHGLNNLYSIALLCTEANFRINNAQAVLLKEQFVTGVTLSSKCQSKSYLICTKKLECHRLVVIVCRVTLGRFVFLSADKNGLSL